MKRCSNCGTLLRSVDKFCPECGLPTGIKSNTQRKQVFEGTLHKCPHCGEAIQSFSNNCPSCGFEFRDVRPTFSVKEFERQLHSLDTKRSPDNSTQIDQQIINLIQSFSIPNAKEDIIDFMILASSNIVGDDYKSTAWMSKMEQSYQKASFLFGKDPNFAEISKIYNRKKK